MLGSSRRTAAGTLWSSSLISARVAATVSVSRPRDRSFSCSVIGSSGMSKDECSLHLTALNGTLDAG